MMSAMTNSLDKHRVARPIMSAMASSLDQHRG